MQTHNATFRVPASAEAFDAALEGLCRVNVGLMSGPSGPGIPPLYEAGVRYRDEPRDIWRHAGDVASQKWGDCEDLSAYRAAELRVSGEDPAAEVFTYKSGPYRYHAVVRRGNGEIEDPSKVLGMGQSNKPMRRNATANVVGEDPNPGDKMVSFEVTKTPAAWGQPGGYRGFVRIALGTPTGGTPQALLTVGPTAATPEAAAKQAVTTATTALLKSPAVQTALQAIPGGPLAAQLLSSSQAQSAIKGAVKALKFW